MSDTVCPLKEAQVLTGPLFSEPMRVETVYDYLLKLARVRFLLADDAGAGKTIMAGLLIRELRMRGLAERILIVGPANLAFQWQRELKEKFDEKFLVLKGSDLRDQFGVNQWLQQKRVITSLDLAKREDILPGLRFALGEPEIDTTSIDNAAFALEDKCYFIRKVGSDGFKIGHQPTMKKVVSDRRASLDEDTEIRPAMQSLIQKEFEKGASIPQVFFPADGAAIQDTPKLTLVVTEADAEWTGGGPLREQIAEWTKQRGQSPRLYRGSLVWCLKKPGRELREKVELWLAWRRVAVEIAEGTLGGDFDPADRMQLRVKVADAEQAARDEVWGGYRFVVLADVQGADGLEAIDLGAGHASASESLCGRAITALKSQALLNESVGAGYLDRNWPPALKESGAWPLTSLRQSFLNGSLTRLVDPDAVLRSKIVEFVEKGDFGVGSAQKPDGSYERIWFEEAIGRDEVAFEADVFLLHKSKAKALKTEPEPGPSPTPQPVPDPGPDPGPASRVLRVSGNVPPEIWNRLGTKLLPKLRSGSDLEVSVDFRVTADAKMAKSLADDLRQILNDLGLADEVGVDEE